MTTTYYTMRHGWATWQVAMWVAPAGVVALDVDAPSDRYVQSKLHAVMRKGVEALASELARRFDLGRWWGYDTGSPGCHIIFEHPAADAKHVLERARWDYQGWHECGGHLCECGKFGVTLRVGHKPGRWWDIIPWASNPQVNIPAHIREHDLLLVEQFPAKEVDRNV